MDGVESQDQRLAELERELERLREENRRLAGKKGRPRRWRSWLSGGLLLLGLVLMVPAGMLLWLHRTVTTPEGYLKAVGPVIEQPAVQAAVQKAATEAVLQRVDVDQLVGQALPENAQFLAPPIAGQVKNYANQLVGQIVASPKFAALWVDVNQRAQARFMQIARGSGDPVVDVSDLYRFVSAQLADTRLAVLANRELPPQVGQIQVANVPALERIPAYVAALETWRWVLLGLSLALLAAAIWAAGDRRRMVLWAGLGWMAATVVTLALVRLARGLYIDGIADPVYRAGAVAIWQTVLNPFLIQILVTALLGLAILVVAWLWGPGRVATGFRSGSSYYLASWRGQLMPGSARWGLVRFVNQHRAALRWSVAGLTALALVLAAPLTLASASLILLLGVILLLILEFLAVPEVATSRRMAETSGGKHERTN